MRGQAEALKRGQVDLRTALVTGTLGLVFSFITTTGGIVWTRYNAAEDMRRQTAANTEEIAQLRGEVRRMAAQTERIEAAFDGVRNAVERLKEPQSVRVRSAGGRQ